MYYHFLQKIGHDCYRIDRAIPTKPPLKRTTSLLFDRPHDENPSDTQLPRRSLVRIKTTMYGIL